jgi:hypothetical protein
VASIWRQHEQLSVRLQEIADFSAVSGDLSLLEASQLLARYVIFKSVQV